MKNRQFDHCLLEIDIERGIVYVHSPDGYTILRVCGLDRGTRGQPEAKKAALEADQIDITVLDGLIGGSALPGHERAICGDTGGTETERRDLPCVMRSGHKSPHVDENGDEWPNREKTE